MKNQRRKLTAIKALVLSALVWGSGLAWAGQVAGTVRQLSGPLIAKKADGKVKVLSLRSEVEQGDTLVSESNTYALIKFIDNSEITMRPNSSFTIDSFAFDEGKPDGDSASFNLVKGGLRSVTGLLGKRNKEKFSLKTPTATIGIRGTTFVAQYVPPPPASSAPGRAASLPPTLMPGLHVFVIDGMISVSNPGGAQNFAAGQFGYVPSNLTPPVIVPANPGLQFTPPPTFSLTPSNGSTQTQSGEAAVDCEVR
ncbi:MAG TPA: FecR family protein [Telluria sp.]|nr:FecR family protein [Telluria sp.]